MSATIKLWATKSVSSTEFRFLDLPKDIRFMIYEYLVVSRIQLMTCVDESIAYEITKLDPGVIQLSRQIYEEVHAATYQRRVGKLVLYFTDHYHVSTDLSRILATAYRSEEHSLEGENIGTFTIPDTWDPSPTLTDQLFWGFLKFHFNTMELPPAPLRFSIERLRSSSNAFFKYAIMRFRHSPRVEYRFMMWANQEDKLYQSPPPSQEIGTGDSPLKHNSVLVCADQRIQGLVLEQQCLQAPNCLSTSLATTEEMAYMRATTVHWAPN